MKLEIYQTKIFVLSASLDNVFRCIFYSNIYVTIRNPILFSKKVVQNDHEEIINSKK